LLSSQKIKVLEFDTEKEALAGIDKLGRVTDMIDFCVDYLKRYAPHKLTGTK